MPSHRFARIVAAVDGSPNSDEALATAIDLALDHQSELTVLAVAPIVPVYMPSGNSFMSAPITASDAPRYQELVEAAVQRAKSAGVTLVTGVCEEGVVVDEILAFLETHPVDLVVVGSRGMSAAKRLLIGSISSALVAHAPCPVLVVRSSSATKPAGSP